MTKIVVPPAAKMGGDPINAVAVLLNQILLVAEDYLSVRETEVTKREVILARKEVDLKEIHAKSELFLTYLQRTFDERRANFKELFNSLDRAMQDGGDVAMILGAITTLAASSPFKDLHDVELVRKNLANPDHEWPV